MKVLVLNTGSGSQRCSLFEVADGRLPDEPVDPIWESTLDSTAPGQPDGRIVIRVRRGREVTTADIIDANSSTAERTGRLLQLLWHAPHAPLKRLDEISAIGHRVVHGGGEYESATRIDPAVEATITSLGTFAPLHNPNNLAGIRVAHATFPRDTPQFAVFDTAFHQTLPEVAATYPGPEEWRHHGIRRHGFHGTSFRWCQERAARLLGRSPNDEDLRLILCHIGGGCSLCATIGGRSVDTTMGLTPLDGIPMCTRAGAIDPGILIHLLRQGVTVDDLEQMLNKRSGLKGLSGLPGDTRIILPEVERGDERAVLAWRVFIHGLRRGIGQMMASLGRRPHALVFTDAIGEAEPALRAAACEPFAFLGVELDREKNDSLRPDADLASDSSTVRVFAIKSREAWQIVRECHARLHASSSA